MANVYTQSYSSIVSSSTSSLALHAQSQQVSGCTVVNGSLTLVNALVNNGVFTQGNATLVVDNVLNKGRQSAMRVNPLSKVISLPLCPFLMLLILSP